MELFKFLFKQRVKMGVKKPGRLFNLAWEAF